MKKRKVYENRSTHNDEVRVMKIFEKAWGVSTTKLPRTQRVDFLLTKKGEKIGFAEVKCRKCNHDAFKTFMVSNNKINNGLQMGKTHGVPFYLIIEWSDKIGYLNISDAEVSFVKEGGRWDRDDVFDVEKMAHFEIENFTFLHEKQAIPDLEKPPSLVKRPIRKTVMSLS